MIAKTFALLVVWPFLLAWWLLVASVWLIGAAVVFTVLVWTFAATLVWHLASAVTRKRPSGEAGQDA